MQHRLRIATALFTGSALLAWLPAQSLPAPVGPGPLLHFTTNNLPETDGLVTLHVAELDGDGPARPIWRNTGNADVLARLDQHHLLLASYGDPYGLLVLDLNTGKNRMLAIGAPHEFVAVHGDAVLHLGDPRDAAHDNYLYRTPWREPSSRQRLCEQRFDRVAQVAGNLAIAVAPADAAVWLVSIAAGTGRAIWTAPTNAAAVLTALSPGGHRLAIGCVPPDGKGLLTVVDLGAGTVVRSWPNLPIHVSPLSSSTPTLEVGWHDDAHVVCSQTRGDVRGFAGDFVTVRYSLASGEIVDEQPYSSIGLHHSVPSPTSAGSGAAATRPPAAFVTDTDDKATRVWRVGAKEPLATFATETQQYGDWHIAPDGQSAIVRQAGKAASCVLFTAQKQVARLLLEGFTYDVGWLPAVAPSPGAAR